MGNLHGTLAGNLVAASLLFRCLLGGAFAAGFLEPLAEIGLQLVGPLVLGDDREHLLQARDPLLGRLRPPVGVFGLLVLGSEIGGHGVKSVTAGAVEVEVVGGSLYR